MDNDFKFKNSQVVKISVSGETGKVVGRADYLADERRYEVIYKAADGRAQRDWWAESALEAV